jgi:hypothetical protein
MRVCCSLRSVLHHVHYAVVQRSAPKENTGVSRRGMTNSTREVRPRLTRCTHGYVDCTIAV